MKPKPEQLGPTYGAQFANPAVVMPYDARPPYSSEAFPVLGSLLGRRDATVLDIGCGTGDASIPLAPHVDQIVPLDRSAAMPSESCGA